MISITIKGDSSLIERFKKLSDAVQTRISEKVLQAGVDAFVSVEQAATPPAKTPGHDNRKIQESIRGRLMTAATAKIGFNVGRYVAPHAHLYVLGTVDRFTGQTTRKVRGRLTTKSNKNAVSARGRMPANDFFAKTTDAAESAAYEAMQQVFDSEMRALQ